MKIETYLVKTKLHTTTLLFSSINFSVKTMISRNFCQKSSNNVLKGQNLFVKYVIFHSALSITTQLCGSTHKTVSYLQIADCI